MSEFITDIPKYFMAILNYFKARYQNTYLQHRDLSVYTITTHSNITSWCRRIYHHYTLKHKYNVDLKCQPSSVTSLRRCARVRCTCNRALQKSGKYLLEE
jgi:hypothetical protein